MASLRLGRTIIRNGNAYRLVFENDDIKTGRRLEYDTPPELTAAIDRYISVERTELLIGKGCDAFWLDRYGEPLSADNIADMIHRQSKRYLGKSFGSHRFRHDIGTTAPLTDSAHPGVAASILGISGRMVEEHYNRASQADVAQKFQASLRAQRAQLEALARREFQRGKPDVPPR